MDLLYRRPAKAQASLRKRAVSPEPSLFTHMKYGRSRKVNQKSQDERSDKKSVKQPHWTAVHARLKNEFTEDEKYHNLMTWLK